MSHNPRDQEVWAQEVSAQDVSAQDVPAQDVSAQEVPALDAVAREAPVPEARVRQPVYAKALRLRHVHPSGMLCFLFFEGSIAIAVLLALAELVSWWAVVALPVAVAAMVKLNDVVAGASAGRPQHQPPPSS